MRVDPLQAIDRIVYLLDRDMAPAAKVRAFLRARRIVEELDPGELERRVLAGTLTELEGIGETTSTVIAQAHRGGTPAYLVTLEAGPGIPLGAGGPYREALRGDCHSHTVWSDGGASLREMALAARSLGHEYLAVTDHSGSASYAHGLDPGRLRAQMAEIGDLNEELAPFRILTGMEVDILADGSLDLEDELLASLDIVVASAHSKLRMERRAMTERLVMALANPHTDILGHPTGRKVAGKGRPPSDFDPELVLAAAKRFDKAVEINCRPERQDPPDELLALAVEWGCKVAIDTDAHAPGQLEWLNYGCDRAATASVPLASVVNTLPGDDLLTWTSGR